MERNGARAPTHTGYRVDRLHGAEEEARGQPVRRVLEARRVEHQNRVVRRRVAANARVVAIA